MQIYSLIFKHPFFSLISHSSSNDTTQKHPKLKLVQVLLQETLRFDGDLEALAAVHFVESQLVIGKREDIGDLVGKTGESRLEMTEDQELN